MERCFLKRKWGKEEAQQVAPQCECTILSVLLFVAQFYSKWVTKSPRRNFEKLRQGGLVLSEVMASLTSF